MRGIWFHFVVKWTFLLLFTFTQILSLLPALYINPGASALVFSRLYYQQVGVHQLEKLRYIYIVVDNILDGGKCCLNWYNKEVTFFSLLHAARNVAWFPLLPSWWWFSLSLFQQASSVFLGALPHQGQLTLYKSGPKIRKLRRWRGG